MVLRVSYLAFRLIHVNVCLVTLQLIFHKLPKNLRKLLFFKINVHWIPIIVNVRKVNISGGRDPEKYVYFVSLCEPIVCTFINQTGNKSAAVSSCSFLALRTKD